LHCCMNGRLGMGAPPVGKMDHRKNPGRFRRLLVLFVLATSAAYGAWLYQQQSAGELPSYQTSPVTCGELVQVVTASGQLNPVTMVEVGSQISGIIQQLLADFNSLVTNGQVIAKIDPATYEANGIQAEGNLASARAALELAQLDEQRAKALRKDKLNTEADYDNALAALHQAEANVKIKEGALRSARVDLARCTIYSPIEGMVLSRNVNVGQTVAASLSAPTLFVIANDLTKMEIEASVAEADIGLVQEGQDADFTVDAFPGQTFHGRVSQIRNAPRTDQNVVTYVTIIKVSNPDIKLKPGMTANVSIFVARRENALKLPNAALRFHPPESRGSKKVARHGNGASGGKYDAAPPGHKKEQRSTERVVYILRCRPHPTNTRIGPEILEPVSLKTGINNAAFTQIVEGLKEGDEVVTGVRSAKAHPPLRFNPFVNTLARQ
jgi:HlyD family secretion protein